MSAWDIFYRDPVSHCSVVSLGLELGTRWLSHTCWASSLVLEKCWVWTVMSPDCNCQPAEELSTTADAETRQRWGNTVCSLCRGFLGGSDGKESACNARDLGSTSGSVRSPGEGHGNPLQYPCLEYSMDRGPWWAAVHGVAKSQTWLSDWHCHTFRACLLQLRVVWVDDLSQWRGTHLDCQLSSSGFLLSSIHRSFPLCPL